MLLCALAGCGDQPPAPNAKALSSAATRAALEKLVDLDVNEASLGEVLDDLSAQANVKFVVNHQSLADAGVSLAKKPGEAFRLRGVTLKSALDQLLRPLECGFHIAEGHVHIESLELQQSQCYSEVYLVSDLVEHDSDRLNEKFLADLMTSTVDPQTWYDVGGFAGIKAAPGALIVSHVADGHEQIVDLLAELRELYESLEPNSPARPISHRSRYPFKRRLSNTPAAIALREALPRIVTYDFKNAPLGEVFDQIAREQKINIVIDDHALEDAGESRQSLVTGRFLDVTLEMAIRGLLRPLSLIYEESDESLRITSSESTNCGAEWPAVYAVDDLLDPASGFDERELARVIAAWVEPQSWDEVGGPGVIHTIPQALVIAQSSDVHAQIAEFLDILARVIQPSDDEWIIEDSPLKASHAIEDKLQKLVSVDRSDLAIRPALNELLKEHGIPVSYWPHEDNGAKDVLLLDKIPARVVHHENTLANILSAELIEREMEWWIEDGRLQIGNPSHAVSEPSYCIYRTTPFYRHALYSPNDPLLDLIKAHVAPESWEALDGFWSATAVPGGLVVYADPDTQRQIGWFLQALRRLEEADAPRMIRCSPCQDFDEISRMLNQMVAIEADLSGQETLGGLLQRLAAAHGLSGRLLIDVTAIMRAAIDKSENPLDLPATEVPTGQMPMRVALTRLLDPHGLEYSIDESRPQARIVIESKEQAKWRRHSTRLYRFEQSPQAQGNGLKRLSLHLVNTVQPGCWGKEGGNIMSVRWPNCLVVSASPEIHEQIAAELEPVLPHIERGEPLPKLP